VGTTSLGRIRLLREARRSALVRSRPRIPTNICRSARFLPETGLFDPSFSICKRIPATFESATLTFQSGTQSRAGV
jgi:hypothetical protein